MDYNPYDLCPCGSGKKVKWCCAATLAEMDRVNELLTNNQTDRAMEKLDQLEKSASNPAYIHTMRARILVQEHKIDEAYILLDHTIAEHPEFAYARETRADMLFFDEDLAEAADGYRDALAHYAPSANDALARVMWKMGSCHNLQGRPLAAWAWWRRALKHRPDFVQVQQSLDSYIKDNSFLPNAARQGLSLKSPDEFSLFNEERSVQWETALQEERDWHLDDAVSAFEALTELDEKNPIGWYNLALTSAWSGDNGRAVEAMEKYVELEQDFETAADAWDLCEVLRMGVGAEDFTDHLRHVALYEVSDVQAFTEDVKSSNRIAVVEDARGGATLHVMDRPVNLESHSLPMIGARPRQLGQLGVVESRVELSAMSESKLKQAEEVMSQITKALQPAGEYQAPAAAHMIDAEPFTNHIAAHDEPMENLIEYTRQYFEEEWTHRELKSLGNLAPLDAAQSDLGRKKLEGLIRFKERTFPRFEIPYNFDRLRNKLGLEPTEALAPDAVIENDVGGYSAAQLSELDPAALDDGDLAKAFQNARSLDAPTLAAAFAEEIVGRPSAFEKCDMTVVFRQIAASKMETGDYDSARSIIDQAVEYDQTHYGGENTADWEIRRARTYSVQGDYSQAVGILNAAVEKFPEQLELLASAVEINFSAGDFAKARQIAEKGLEQAKQQRDKSYQGQFRDYLEEASARA